MRNIISASVIILSLTRILFPQGSVLLVGGGAENYNDWSDKPYRWFVEHAPNKKILVLHYADTTTWFSGYFPSLSPCKVSNMFINSSSLANDSATYRFILQHDGVFMRGGDQAQYVSKWRGTLTQKAIKEIYQRGGVIGGTSAGEMILSSVSYLSGNTDNGAIMSSPSTSITLNDDFLQLVPNSIAESHTNERGRIGRLPVFIARYKNLSNKAITGIAVDANTALAIGPDGIGEVMGSTAVAILRMGYNTSYLIEPGKPFSMKNLGFDQLIVGYKYNFNTGQIIVPPSASVYSANKVSLPKSVVILDGSGKQNDWFAATGSIKKLQAILNSQNDIIGIVSSPLGAASSNEVNSFLTSLGISSRQLFIDESHKNDVILKAEAASCNAYIFIGNSIDSAAGLLNKDNAVGSVLYAKIEEGKPLLFISDDVMLAGEKAISGIYSSAYNAYYGSLKQVPGLNIIAGIQFVPRFFQNPNNTKGYDYTENRVMGLFWSMAKQQSSYGMLIEAGTSVTIANNKFEVTGVSTFSVPVLLIDARNVTKFDYPQFRRPGKPNPVQDAALIGGELHFLAPGETGIITHIRKEEKILPAEFTLEQNYPNPFNPSTVIRYSVSETADVKLAIFDLLGRKVAVLIDSQMKSGSYTAKFEPVEKGSGIYFCRLDESVNGITKSKTIKMVFIK